MSASIASSEIVYAGYVTVTKNSISTANGTIEREIIDQGDAVAVLSFDPERKVAMLVRLLRAPTLLRGYFDELLEVPAGMIDAGEDALETARRELIEETGLAPPRLDHIATVWSSPGVSAERVALFLAAYSAKDRKGEGGGRGGENENVTVVEVPLVELADSSRALDMKTLALVLELRLRHPELFAKEE